MAWNSVDGLGGPLILAACSSQLAHLLDWLVYYNLSAGTAGALCVCSLIAQQVWSWSHSGRGFREQQEGPSLDAQTLFKPLLCHLRSFLWPKQVTWPDLRSVGGTLRLQHKGSWIQGEGRTYGHPLCSLLWHKTDCTLYPVQEGWPWTYWDSCFQEFKKKNQSYIGRPEVLKTGNLKLAIDKE